MYLMGEERKEEGKKKKRVEELCDQNSRKKTELEAIMFINRLLTSVLRMTVVATALPSARVLGSYHLPECFSQRLRNRSCWQQLVSN